MNIFVYICALVSFLVTYLATPWWIKYLRKINLEVKDQNKENTPLVPISGGLAVFSGIMAGLLLFIFIRTFISKVELGLILDAENLLFLFAAMISIFIITLVGFLDDLVIDKGKDSSAGLRQWQKPLLTLCAAIPLMVVSAGTTDMGLPFIGVVDFGILYPLLLVPIGVIGAANMVNMLAGFNGLEAGMGVIYIGSLGLFAYFNHSYLAALIALVTFASLGAFYLFNKVPAKILPGDSLTYLLGGVLAVIAILGNIERAALIISIPFFIEFILKARSKFKAQTYGFYKEGKTHSKHGEIVYSLPHLLTRTGKFTEKHVVWIMISVSTFFSLLIWFI